MVARSAEHPKSVDLLREVLLDYLQAGWVRNWPGIDGITVDDILNCYPQASGFPVMFLIGRNSVAGCTRN